MITNNNTLNIPTINGLQTLNLDELTTADLIADNIYLANLETSDITIDNDIIMSSGAKIITNGLEISDVELSYLDGIDSNIKVKIDNNTNLINTNISDIDSLETKTTDMSYTSGISRFSTSLNVRDALLGTSFGTTINNDSVIMKYFTSAKNILELTNLITNHTAPVLKIRGKYNLLCEWATTPFFEIKTGNVYLYNDAKIIFTDLSEQTTGFTNSLKTTYDAYNSTITTNSGNITTNSNNITTNSGNITTNSNNITTNSGNITTNSNNISTLQDKTYYLSKSTGLSTFSSDVLCNTINLNNNIDLNGVASKIIFYDGTEQSTALTSALKSQINSHETILNDITRSGDLITFDTGTILKGSDGGAIKECRIKHINCYEKIEYPDSSIQTTGFTDSLKSTYDGYETIVDDYETNIKNKPLGAWYYTSTNTIGSGAGNITGSETEDMAIDTIIKSTGTATYLYSGKLYAVSGTLKFTNLNSLKHIGLTIKVVIPSSPDIILHTTQYVETRFDATDGNYEEATVSIPMNVFCPASDYTTAPEIHFDIDYGADPYGDNIQTDCHAYLTGLG
jgi:hypothetical protein